MSLVITNNANGGTNGSGVTYHNSGETSGEAPSYILIGTGASIKFTNTPARGALSYEFKTTGTSAESFLAFDTSSISTAYLRFYVYLPTLTPASTRLCHLNDGTAISWTMGIRADGRLSIRDSSSAQMSISSLALPTGRWVRIEARVVSSATVGTSTVKIFTEADSPYPAENVVSGATFNTKPAALDFNQIRFGIVDTAIANCTYYLDGLTINDTGYAGPGDPNLLAPLLRSNNAESGVNGVSVSSTNSGNSTNNFIQAVEPSATIRYSNTQAAHGSLSYEFISSNGTENRLTWRLLASNSVAMRFYAYFTGFPPNSTGIGQLTTSFNVGFEQLAIINFRNDGKVSFSDRTTVFWTSTATLSLNTWYRFEVFAQTGVTPTTGTLSAAIYSLDSGTALDSTTTSTADLGSLSIGWARFGKLSANAWTNTFYIDEIAVRQAASGFIGAYSGPPSVPAAYAGSIPHLGWGRSI